MFDAGWNSTRITVWGVITLLTPLLLEAAKFIIVRWTFERMNLWYPTYALICNMHCSGCIYVQYFTKRTFCWHHVWLPARWASGFSGDHQQDHQCLWLLSCYSFILSSIACILLEIKLLLLLCRTQYRANVSIFVGTQATAPVDICRDKFP